jgi:hypothetical protein
MASETSPCPEILSMSSGYLPCPGGLVSCTHILFHVQGYFINPDILLTCPCRHLPCSVTLLACPGVHLPCPGRYYKNLPWLTCIMSWTNCIMSMDSLPCHMSHFPCSLMCLSCFGYFNHVQRNFAMPWGTLTMSCGICTMPYDACTMSMETFTVFTDTF